MLSGGWKFRSEEIPCSLSLLNKSLQGAIRKILYSPDLKSTCLLRDGRLFMDREELIG